MNSRRLPLAIRRFPPTMISTSDPIEPKYNGKLQCQWTTPDLTEAVFFRAATQFLRHRTPVLPRFGAQRSLACIPHTLSSLCRENSYGLFGVHVRKALLYLPSPSQSVCARSSTGPFGSPGQTPHSKTPEWPERQPCGSAVQYPRRFCPHSPQQGS